MLQIKVPISPEGWDDEKQEFVEPRYVVLEMEHSLVSLSKWEQRWHKPFISRREKTMEETIDYIRCMTLTPNVRPETYLCLSEKNLEQINDYIEDTMTATTFSDDDSKGPQEIVTNELIYYWMIALGIPQEYQHWHLNRLLTLIRVCKVKNSPPKKMSDAEKRKFYRELNEKRKRELNTTG